MQNYGAKMIFNEAFAKIPREIPPDLKRETLMATKTGELKGQQSQKFQVSHSNIPKV